MNNNGILNLIKSRPDFYRTPSKEGPSLRISEMFCNTLQGENFVGVPSTFIRLQGCTLRCVWCDTLDVWVYGNPYHIDEIMDMWEENGMIEKFKGGQHIIWTGGSPLMQQKTIILFIERFIERFGFKPFMEIENECTLVPNQKMIEYIDLWNNSPKLNNSQNKLSQRYKPEILKQMSELENSYFKFVICNEGDWLEIKKNFLDPGLIRRDQMVLMPEGITQEELNAHYPIVIEICIRENIRFTNRLQVTIFGDVTGV